MEKLKQVLTQEDTVLFIGSGLSLWSGLPTWAGLIEELARFVELAGGKADLIRAEAQRGDFLQAASYGFDKLTKHQIGDFIRTACRYGVAKPHEIHRRVVSLGTRCFVTTNYDNLLEEALRQWQPNRFFRPPITNRHLTETAEIVHARAIDFVFKPHGDAADSDSIILTREQYRLLLPQGERQNALESLKMLLASRPVVYLGFGLRDPDFLYVRDLLANTYKGGTRDHYAIMADVSEAECDYWRRNYGIHLVGYATTIRPDQTKDHAALLALLGSFAEPAPSPLKKIAGEAATVISTPDVVLSLARHAARLARTPKLNPEFPIRVHTENDSHLKSAIYHRPDKFDHHLVEKFLDDGPNRGILVGLPGAGKTYALRQAAARHAEKLHELCLSEVFDEASVVIPILVDLKLYRGDLAELVNQVLPKSLPLESLIQRFQLKVFLDSFNEMPREYWESGAYEADFSEFTSNIESSSLIIGSRTSDGLDKFGFPVYCLDQIDEAVVAEEIQKMNIAIEGRFDREILFLLQKPFYFQLAKSGAVSFKKDAHPRDFYQALLENLHRNFKERFAREFDLEKALSLAAYDAINRGEEAYPLADLLSALKSGLEAAGILDIDARDVANWLVSTSTLIPYIGGRVAFAHQSITEYLAATELARRYQSSPQIFKEKIALTRWDQALFLALSILPKTHADAFFHDIANADFELALAAVKYVEVGRDEIVSNLLSLIPEHLTKFGPFDNRIGWIVESNLPISEAHEPKLRALMKAGGMIGAAAVKRLFELKGAIVKDELLLEMLNARSDYNYCCNGIVSVLQPLVTAADIPAIVALVDSIAHEITLDSGDDVAHGFTSGVAMLLVDLEISAIKKCFLMNSESNHVPEIYARILCRMLWRVHSTQALELAGELLLRGVKKAATSIYFVANFAEEKNELSWDYFKREHVDHLIAIAEVPEEDAWSLKALRCICLGRPDLAQIVRDRASGRFGVVRAALLFCASPGSEEQVFEALNELVNMNQEQRMQQPTHFLEQIEVDWAGRETLFVQVLKIRDTKLALTVLDQVYGEKGAPLGFLDIGPIEWWLEWLAGECNSNLKHILLERISWLFSIYLSQDVRHSFVVEFNKDDSIYRSLLARSILIYQNHLTSDDFSSDAISFLLRGLECERGFDFRGHLLGRTATEKFVIDRLLPLIRDAQDPLKGNIEELVRQAGSRHGKRYLLN